MILDKRAELCDAVALNTGAAGTYLIGDVYDTQLVNKDIGLGEDIWCVAQIETTATSGGGATLQIQLVSDAQAAIATNGTATVHQTMAALAVASCVAGTRLWVCRLNSETFERYLGVLQITGVAAFTAGKVDVFFTKDLAKWAAQADGVN